MVRGRVFRIAAASIVLGLLLFVLHRSYVQPDDDQFVNARRITMRFSVDGNAAGTGLWTYVATDTNRQKVLKCTYDTSFELSRMTTDASGKRLFWAAAAPGSHADVTFDIVTPARNRLLPRRRHTIGTDVAPDDVKKLVAEIVGKDIERVDVILTKLYEYTRSELILDPAASSDAIHVLKSGYGSALGIHKAFSQLVNAAGLPATIARGVYLGDDKPRLISWVDVQYNRKWYSFDCVRGSSVDLPNSHIFLARGAKRVYGASGGKAKVDIQQRRVVRMANGGDSHTAALQLPMVFQRLGLDLEVSAIFVLFPICALLIGIIRNVIGVETFGVFMPMLVAAACHLTGLVTGIAVFFAIMTFAALLHRELDRGHVLKVPRLAAIISIITVLFIIAAALNLTPRHGSHGIVAFFPVVVLTFAAERLHRVVHDDHWSTAVKLTLTTLATIIACYLIFSSVPMARLFLLYPELLLVVCGAQILVGSWSGLRLTEHLRFRCVTMKPDSPKDKIPVLGINRRNRNVVYPLNDRRIIAIANDKIRAKKYFEAGSVPTAKTLSIVVRQTDVDDAISKLREIGTFVVKPANGSQGSGILVIVGRDDGNYITASGRRISHDELAFHLHRILIGAFSMNGARDAVLVEELLTPSKFFAELSPLGICDIRIILVQGTPMAAMLRIPTAQSDGKANLHRGAVGIPICMHTGITGDGMRSRQVITHHPDSNFPLAGHEIPEWPQILGVATAAQHAVPLGYAGVDIAFDASLGPVVLEINAHPGLEIQNVQGAALRPQLTGVAV